MKRIALGLSLCATFATGVAAEPIQLKFSNPGVPNGHVQLRIVTPLAERITKDSNGTVEVKLFPGPTLGAFPVIYDRLMNGVTDMTFGLLGPISSQYPQTMVASLPFETPNATIGSRALWSVLSSGLIAGEWHAVKPLAMVVFPNAGFHARKPIATLDDVRGLKFSVQSRIAAGAVERLGGAPITLAVTDLYQSLQRGTIDVVTIGWPATSSYKVFEVGSNHLTVPIGPEVTYLAMNKDSFAKLPADGKAAVDKNIGDAFQKYLGGVLDDVDDKESHAIGAMPGQSITQLKPDEEARWRARVTPVAEQWASTTPEGAKVLAAYREAIAKMGKAP
jgi:TRAP-type C4-dicarboxylate transport system substrate-binding protein